MDPATFVVTALAGALIKEVATDSYKAVKAILVDAFGLGKPIETLEDAPNDEDAREFLSKKLAKTGAVDDLAVLDGAERIANELEKMPDDTTLGASLTVKKLKAEAAEFRRNRIRAGGAATFEDLELTGRLIVEDNEVGDDRKR